MQYTQVQDKNTISENISNKSSTHLGESLYSFPRFPS